MNKKGFLLIEFLIALMALSIISLLIFQLATILVVKVKTSKNTMSKTMDLWLVQDLVTKDLKILSEITKLENGFVGKSPIGDISWYVIKNTLHRKHGKYNYGNKFWVESTDAVAANGIESLELLAIDNGFLIKLISDKTINFFVRARAVI